MASSSVSQDDIDNDFEKNNRRSRIRTARARQINPSGTVNQNEKITFKNINKLRTFQNFSKLVQNCLKLFKKSKPGKSLKNYIVLDAIL